MFPSTSSTSTSCASPLIIQAARRMLLHNSNPYFSSNSKAAPPMTVGAHRSYPYKEPSSFDANVVMVLSVLLCALVCALGLNSIIRCALRNRVSYVNAGSSGSQLANIGIKRKALKTFPIVIYLAGSNPPRLDTECVICLSEFATGERIRVLPKCDHGFHTRCIDKWLTTHSSCPTCRQCLIDTCQKTVSHTQAHSSETPTPAAAQLHAGTIVPLENEGFIRNLNSIC